MNKLLYVNIGGVVFQIDENAYNQLDQYLNSIRKKYASAEDGDEIIKDIENRIAELFHEKVGERGAITSDYVAEIISVMGKPEDYEGETTQKSASAKTEDTVRRSTKFYRDRENNILGGVCAGFAAKFDIDALWIRLAFVIAFFFFGTGFLLYVILWIIIPEAKTTAEKIEMRGDKVDISNIEKTVKDEASQFKERMKDFGNEVKDTFSKEKMEKTKRNAGDFIENAVETLKPVVKSIAKVIAFGMLVICLIVIVAFSVELFTNWGENFMQVDFLGDHIMNGGRQAWILVTCASALFLIPLIGLIFSSIKFLMGVKKKTKFVGRSLLVIWLVCLVTVIYLGITIGQNFKYEADSSDKINVVQPLDHTLYVQLDPSKVSASWHTGFHEHWGFIRADNDDKLFKQIHISFEKSSDTTYAVIVNKTARGANSEDAKQNARNFDFQVKQQGDSLLLIPANVELKEDEVWRYEEVHILIRIPSNNFVKIDPKLESYIEDNEFTSGMHNDELYDRKLKMTTDGLKPVY